MATPAAVRSRLKLSEMWLGLAFAAVLCGVAFRGGLAAQIRKWVFAPEYNHGFAILAIALWFLWVRRKALCDAWGQPHFLGLLLVVAATAMLIIGELAAVFLLLQVGFLVALAGILAAMGGLSLLRVAALPIGLLAFAIPVPSFIDAMLSWRLQLLSTELGVFFLTLVHVPVYSEGNIIDLGIFKIQVADACSGLRYLYPFLSLGFLAAYLFNAPGWQRAFVVVSTIPITIFMNSVRIAMIGITVHQWGRGAAEGFLHLFEGWVIFVGCSMILWLEIWALARLTGRRFFEAWGAMPHLTYAAGQPARPQFNAATLLAIGALVTAIPATSMINNRMEMVPKRERFASFPQRMGDWQGRESFLEPGIEQTLHSSDYYLADFQNGKGPDVNVFMAYYESQRKGESPHSPSVCIPGGGWSITRLDRVSIPLGGNNSAVTVNRAVISRNSQKQIVYYWFDERGRNIASEWSMKWYLLVDSIFKRRTDGALVRLTTPLLADESVGTADARLVSVMEKLVPVTSRFIPGSRES